MYQSSSLTEKEALAVRENGRLLHIGYDSIMNYHGGAMPAGVALAFRMFSGLTERFQALYGDVPERSQVSFYTGLGENGQGIIDTAEALYRVKSRERLNTDILAGQDKDAPDAPGGGKYFFSGIMGAMSWEASLRDGIIDREFYVRSLKMHRLLDEGREPTARDTRELMDVRKAAEQRILKKSPAELFLFKIDILL